MFDPLRAEALGNHNNPSLHIEAQSHLSTAFVVLFPDGYKEFILQQGGTFQVHPEPEMVVNK